MSGRKDGTNMEDYRAAAEDARFQQLSGSIERVIYATNIIAIISY